MFYLFDGKVLDLRKDLTNIGLLKKFNVKKTD